MHTLLTILPGLAVPAVWLFTDVRMRRLQRYNHMVYRQSLWRAYAAARLQWQDREAEHFLSRIEQAGR